MDILLGFWNLVPITLVQGLIYAFVALGVMIPFRIVNIPDITAEGAFPLGGCVAATLLVQGAHPLLSTALAVAAGFCAGAATALFHLKFRIHSLLAGVLVVTMLWSINLRFMGRPNVATFGLTDIFTWISEAIARNLTLQILFFGVLLAVVLLLLWWMLHTEVGLALRGIGANAQLAPALGVNYLRYAVAGLGLANAITALAGALSAQLQGYGDVSMGFGLLVNGLASVILGEAIIGRRTITTQLLAPVIGCLVYYQLTSLALSLGLAPSDLKLVTGLFVLGTIGWTLAGRGRARALAT